MKYDTYVPRKDETWINFKSMRKVKQKCYIEGCARYGSVECTDDASTCLMLERMRNSNSEHAACAGRTMLERMFHSNMQLTGVEIPNSGVRDE